MASQTVLIMANVDDVPGEMIPCLFERLMDMGAKNVHAIPALTKKGRQEFIFLVDTPHEKVTAVGDFLASELGTLGVRILEASKHVEFDYQARECRLAVWDEGAGEKRLSCTVSVKLIYDSQGRLVTARAEYDDLKSALDLLAGTGVDVPFTALKGLVESAVLVGKSSTYRNLSIEPQLVGRQ